MTLPAQLHVSLHGVGKAFGGVPVLADIKVDVTHGDVHALVGENGAGKSTLGRIIAGALTPDTGTMTVEGRPVRFRSPRAAARMGITMVAQELAVVPQLTVMENVLLGVEPRRSGIERRAALRKRFEELEERFGLGLSGDARTGSLRVADQQKVEILRAVAREARLVVMDEPTSALTTDEVARLHALIASIKREGITVIYVSHFLEHVLEVADTVTVMRDGRIVRTRAAAEETIPDLIQAMIGREVTDLYPEKRRVHQTSPSALSVSGLSRPPTFNDVSFEIAPGEIVGLAGLVGSGRSEVARAIFGADSVDRGRVEVLGRPIALGSVRKAIAAGVAMLPESRKEQGLALQRPVAENITLVALRELSALGVVRRGRERERVLELTSRVQLRGRARRVDGLSGGNQQKVLLARWMLTTPSVLIADEPTRGVDVGAKASIHELLCALAASGTAILLISSEIEEIVGLAHRVLVIRTGRIIDQFEGDAITSARIAQAALNDHSGPRPEIGVLG